MEESRRFQPELDGFPVAVMRVDDSLRPVNANVAWHSLMGDDADAESDAWLSVFDAQERRRIRTLMQKVQRTSKTATLEARSATPDHWLEVRIAPSHDGGEASVVVVALDISEHKRREAMLNFDVMHDPLTGVHNRIALIENTQFALARLRRQPTIMALLYVDLDHFKRVNDRYGHETGDQVLIRAARRMRLAIRPADMLARTGGDEFVALCESFSSLGEAERVAQRLVTAFDEPIRTSGPKVKLTASVGVAPATTATWNAQSLLDRADKAMYKAKEGGRNRIFVDPPNGALPKIAPYAPLEDADARGEALDHLSRLAGDLAEGWAESLPEQDDGVTSRWRTASHHVDEAINALREETPGKQ